ncbi:unnamed protein product [Rhizopus microsporus]
MILTLLEDNVFSDSTPKADAQRLDLSKDDQGSLVSSTPTTPSFKRKRSVSEVVHERKMQKLSSSLANDIARSLSVDDDDEDMGFQFTKRTQRHQEDNPMPTLRRISLSGTSNPCSYSLEQWMRQQAEMYHIPLFKYKELSDEKQKELRKELDLLQTPNQTFDQLREHLCRVLKLADELGGDHTLNFTQIFPEWSIYEYRINSLARFVQAMEDMNNSIHTTIPRTSDLLQDIKRLQTTLDSKLALYGDALSQNGLEWKAMGLPVDDHLLAATKQWLFNLCVGLMEALELECKKVGDNVSDMSELYDLPVGEELMTSILCGLEFVSEASACIGYSSPNIVYSCRAMVTIYSQWICENLDHLHDKATEEEVGKKMRISNAVPTKRVDIRYMQLLDNMIRAISCLLTLAELGIVPNGSSPSVSDTHISLDNLTSVLVEFTVRAIGVIQTEKNQKKVTGNVLANPQATVVYMSELLLSFVDRVIELGGSDVNETKRVQTLHVYLKDIESSIEH